MTDTEKEIKVLAANLGKHECRKVVKGKKKYLLCGTCLAYEDELCENIRESFIMLAKLFDLKPNIDSLEDCVSEVRDEVLKKFEELVNGKFIYGSNEY